MVIVESPEAVTRYRKDSSIPLVDVVNSFDVFVTNKHGAQGVMDRASKSQLENEFNTYPPILGLFLLIHRARSDDVIQKILKDGKVEQTKSAPKFGIGDAVILLTSDRQHQ